MEEDIEEILDRVDCSEFDETNIQSNGVDLIIEQNFGGICIVYVSFDGKIGFKADIQPVLLTESQIDVVIEIVRLFKEATNEQ